MPWISAHEYVYVSMHLCNYARLPIHVHVTFICAYLGLRKTIDLCGIALIYVNLFVMTSTNCVKPRKSNGVGRTFPKKTSSPSGHSGTKELDQSYREGGNT